jgi:lysophospholipase L1-like esterase
VSFPWKIIAAGGLALGITTFGVRLYNDKRKSLAQGAPKRVALIGDSYAVGLGPELAKLIPSFKFEGHVGTNTAQWATHSSKCGQCGDWIPDFKPDVVLVALGVNDSNAPNISNYQTIVRGLHGLGARVVWIEPPAEVNALAVRNAINALGVTTVPATRVSVASDKLHLHPSVAGYQTWAAEVLQTLGRNDLLPLQRTA